MSPTISSGRSRAERGRLVGCAALLSILTACGRERLQPPPDTLTTGIVVYQDIEYRGASGFVSSDIPFLRGHGSPCREFSDSGDDPYFSIGSPTWSNCISSVRIAPGWKATLYADPNFKGSEVQLTGDVADLRTVPGDCGDEGFNDCVSSIRVSRR